MMVGNDMREGASVIVTRRARGAFDSGSEARPTAEDGL